MRTLMTLLTLGAAGVGYTYLQQSPAVGEPYFEKSTTLSLLDGNRSAASKVDATRGSAKDLVNRVHEHTKSILDEFANQHGGHSDAPSDNAFQRLMQVTQIVGTTLAPDSEVAMREVSGKKAVRLPPSKLDELQRTAFDPAAVDESQSDLMIAAANERDDPVINVSKVDPKTMPKRTTATATSTAAANISVGEWKVIGKTTERRPMHSMHLGTGGTRTLVIAGLNGEDRVAVRWLEQLADALASRPALLNNNEVLFFRAGNPDGLVHNVKENARGVPLNRNFPSRRYRPTLGLPAFAVPASEVETRVMLDTMYTFRPRRVIHLVATSARSQVLYNRLAKGIANELERTAKLSVLPLDAEQFPGSIEDFADGTLEAAVLSLKLDVGSDWKQTWTKLQPRVLSAVVGQSVDPDDEPVAAPQDPDRTPIPSTSVDPVSRHPRRRGYEELPPPPLQ